MKIIKLNEQKLNEAFSPSMPRWLKDRFQMELSLSGNKLAGQGRYQKPRRNFSREFDALTKKNNMNRVPVARNASRDDHSYNLWDAAIANNINLNSGKFIEGPVPENARDPRLKAPNIAFISLKRPSYNGKDYIWDVYSPQLNPNAESNVFGDSQAFKYHNIKQMQPYMDAFCYIDMSDPENQLDIEATRAARAANYNSQDRRFDRGTPGDYDPQYRMVPYNKRDTLKNYGYPESSMKLDKSGYSRLPNITKYVDALKAHGNDKILKKLQSLYEDANYIYAQLPYILQDSLEGKDFSQAYRSNATSDIESAISSLDDFKRYYDRALGALDDFKKTQDVSNIEVAESNLDWANSQLNRVKERIGEWLPTIVDWDTDDVEWEE